MSIYVMNTTQKMILQLPHTFTTNVAQTYASASAILHSADKTRKEFLVSILAVDTQIHAQARAGQLFRPININRLFKYTAEVMQRRRNVRVVRILPGDAQIHAQARAVL